MYILHTHTQKWFLINVLTLIFNTQTGAAVCVIMAVLILSVNCVGNYYSMRCQHEKAALYFQRALKLSPRCLGAWTLMGHEYMEMKNTSAAIQAYRCN